MKKISFLFTVLIALAIAWWYVSINADVAITPTMPTSTPPIVVTTSTPVVVTSTPEAKIQLDMLVPGALLTSSSTITGRARGPWYFEASFPVELRDSNNVLLVQKPAQATSDWMTTDWVPFTVTLNFPSSTTATGTLIFKKDNPSGEPVNDDQYSIEVQF